MSQTLLRHKLARFRPTVDAKFHIDYDWWEKSGKNFRLYLRDQLCDECRDRFRDHQNTENVDWVDPDTGEVHRTDALRECLRTRCANDPDYINERLSLVSGCFRVFLANNNQPLSPNELNQLLPWASPETILRTLSSGQVYLGLRPI
ncbi:hypothetical protein BH10CHL1_BH10CHL1_09830 [soil metagenome]|jgi:hypothetical protein|nr:hypothetical protein [Chloroflexota bacterium]